MPTSADIDRVFQALGDPTRRAIIARLTLGPQSVSHLADPLGVTLTAVAQHLRVLEDTGFVRTEKLGRVRTCRLQASGFRAVEQWAAEHRALWERRMDALGELLAEEDEEES
jgi:DNA-binding transcriptional ArsR family regulator